MLFFGSAALPIAAEALANVRDQRSWFDDVAGSFFGVTVDPSDETARRIAAQVPGYRFILDYDRAVSRQFAAIDEAGRYTPYWLLLDRTLRAVADFPIGQRDAALAAFRALVDAPVMPDWAPVVMVPNVLEPERATC